MTTLPKRFFPLIHCVSPFTKQGTGHALLNTQIAFRGGADGVFLIGHNMPYTEVLYIYEQVRKQFFARWIGINLLDVSAADDWPKLRAIAQREKVNALWMDSLPEACRAMSQTDAELFGGVAFKYRDSDLMGEGLFMACQNALNYVDTVTTSGDKTGSPPDVAKVQAMREAIRPHDSLALASGVSVENVALFKPYVDTFLVASSITERRADRGGQEYLVQERVTALAAAIHSCPAGRFYTIALPKGVAR